MRCCDPGQYQDAENSRRRSTKPGKAAMVLLKSCGRQRFARTRSGRRLVWPQLGEMPLVLVGVERKNEGLDRIGKRSKYEGDW